MNNKILRINNYFFDLKNLTFFSIGLGIFYRFAHLIFYGVQTPFRLGGLFLAFSKEIYKTNFTLPINIPFYTNGGIPFAYPPLPFFIESFLVYFLKIPEFFIVNTLPVFFSIISLIVFVLLIKKANISERAKSFSIISFSLTPQAFTEQIMGAGLSESIGTLSLIVFGYCLYSYLNQVNIKSIVLLSFSLALCIYSSPGSALASIIIFPISQFYFLIKSLILDEKKKLNALMIGLIISLFTMIITLPYWYSVISNHGINIFLKSVIHQFNSGNEDFLFLANYIIRLLLNFNFIYVGSSGIWNAVIVVCFFYLLSKKYFLIPIVLLCIHLIPRESIWITPIIGSVIFGLFFSNNNFFEYKKGLYPIFFSVLFLNSFFYMVDFISFNQNSRENLTLEEISLLEELGIQIPPTSKVVVLSNEGFREWFPFLVERTVMNVEYGTEFDFEKQEKITSFNNSIQNCQNLNCIVYFTEKTFGFDKYYFIIDKQRLNYGFNLQGLEEKPNIVIFN